MLRHESTSSQSACEQEDRSCVDVAYRVLQLALELGLGVLGLDHRHAGDEDAAVVDDGELPGPVLGLGLACDELAVRDVGRVHGEGHAQGWRPGGQAEHLSKRIVGGRGVPAKRREDDVCRRCRRRPGTGRSRRPPKLRVEGDGAGVRRERVVRAGRRVALLGALAGSEVRDALVDDDGRVARVVRVPEAGVGGQLRVAVERVHDRRVAHLAVGVRY